MKMVKLGVGIILLIVGLIFAALSHETHTSLGLSVGVFVDHTYHVALGVILIIVAIVVLYLGRK